jgi:hypothetical protein
MTVRMAFDVHLGREGQSELEKEELRAKLRTLLGSSDDDLFDWIWGRLEKENSEDIGVALAEPETGPRDLAGIVEDKGWLKLVEMMRGGPSREGEGNVSSRG